MKHVMLDIETLGKKAGCIILSIGACTFDPRGEGYDDTFYQNIDPFDCRDTYGLHSDPSTVKWWSEQSEASREQLTPNRVPLKDALKAFHTWFGDVRAEQVWSQGAAFDFPILTEAFERTGGQPPWAYWAVRDTRTLYAICDFDPRSVKRKGTYHNALDDSIHQVSLVQKALVSG